MNATSACMILIRNMVVHYTGTISIVNMVKGTVLNKIELCGEWDVSTYTTCGQKKHTILQLKTGNGQICPFINGQELDCQPGDGGCP